MTIKIAIVTFILFIFTGCSTQTQVLNGRIYHSPFSPKLKFEVAPGFTYIGELNSHGYENGVGDALFMLTPMQIDTHLFGKIGDNQKVTHLIAVKVSRIDGNWEFTADPFEGWSELIDRGDATLGRSQYDYAITFLNYSRQYGEYFKSKNLQLGKGYLTKVYSRFCGTLNCRVSIFYAEDSSVFIDRYNAKTIDKYLETFNNNFDLSFSLVN